MKLSSSRRYVLLAAGIGAMFYQTGFLAAAGRERISINDDWRFIRDDPADQSTNLTLVPVRAGRRGGPAAGPPVNSAPWPYILASGGDLVKDPAKRVARPEVPFATEGIPYAAPTFDDRSWRRVDLPHDFGVEGVFLPPGTPGSSGSTGRLPCFGQGEFVWTGFDYLGEPTPFDPSRSSYFGIIDLAGFKKDRFCLYQSHWRPDLPMAHILPHWTWPERVGQVTPVFVYTSGDEAELFLNGDSLGRRKKGRSEYRLRWDDVVYEPGELKVVAYRDGKEWAADSVRTAGPAAKLALEPDRATIAGDGRDLSFVTLMIQDNDGLLAPRADHFVTFEISGPGRIVATDNGDPTDMTSFKSVRRRAFNGLALVIVRARPRQTGVITLAAKSEGLTFATATINLQASR